jgi:type IV secretion system protein VirD4
MRQGGASLLHNTYGKSMGRNGNYSTNYQITGRELMTPDEVRMLDNRYALLFIRGERPVLDEKFEIMRHPNVGSTTDGNAPAFVHGQVTRTVASVSVEKDPFDESQTQPETPAEQSDFLLLSEEDLEELLQNEEELSHEKRKANP